MQKNIINILEDKVPFSVWVPIFDGQNKGFTDINELEHPVKWPIPQKKIGVPVIPRVVSPKPNIAKKDELGKRRRNPRVFYAELDDGEMADNLQVDEEYEPHHEAFQSRHNKDNEDYESEDGIKTVKRRMRRKTDVDLAGDRSLLRGRVPETYKESIQNITQLLNNYSEITSADEFTAMLKFAGRFETGKIMINVKALLDPSQGDHVNCFRSIFDKK